jgi:hypothetical protein
MALYNMKHREKNIYLEIEIDAEYYSNYKKKEAKRYGQ